MKQRNKDIICNTIVWAVQEDPEFTVDVFKAMQAGLKARLDQEQDKVMDLATGFGLLFKPDTKTRTRAVTGLESAFVKGVAALQKVYASSPYGNDLMEWLINHPVKDEE